LTISATPSSKFTINITSLKLDNTAGDVHDFSNTAEYTWTIAKTNTGVIGFDPAAFNLDGTAFSNPLGSGFFKIELANAGNDIVLKFVHPDPMITMQPVAGAAECSSNFTFTVAAS